MIRRAILVTILIFSSVVIGAVFTSYPDINWRLMWFQIAGVLVIAAMIVKEEH